MKIGFRPIIGFLSSSWGKGIILSVLLYISLFFVFSRYNKNVPPVVQSIGNVLFRPLLIFQSKDSGKEMVADTEKIAVSAILMHSKEMTPYIDSPGIIEFIDRIDSFSKVHGRLEKVYVEEGQSVKKGQKLFKMETLPLELELMKQRAKLESAKARTELARERYLRAKKGVEARLAELAKAETILERAQDEAEKAKNTFEGQKKLFKMQALSKEAIKKAELEWKGKEARLSIAEKDVRIKKIGLSDEDISEAGFNVPQDHKERRNLITKLNTKIEKAELDVALGEEKSQEAEIKATKRMIEEAIVYSPLHGVVAKKYKTEGTVLSGGGGNEAVLTLINRDNVYAVFNVSEQDSIHIYKRMKVGFSADVFPGKKFSGKVFIVSPIVDSKAHTVQVKAIVRNQAHSLKPGMFVRAHIYTGKENKILLLPNSALIPKEDGSVEVFVIKGGHAYRTLVELGQKYEEKVEVLKGLVEGDIVAIDRLSQLRVGMNVNPVFKE